MSTGVAVPVFALFGNRRSFAGSGIGSIAETQEMLDFCAEHGIGAEVEVIAADAVTGGKVQVNGERTKPATKRSSFLIGPPNWRIR